MVIMAALLAGVVGLVAIVSFTFYPQGDPVIRYQDVTPFRAFFKDNRNTWPLQAETVRARFGVPNLYMLNDNMSITGARTRSNSAWIYRTEVGDSVLLIVRHDEVTHAFRSPKVSQPMDNKTERPLEILRPSPPELTSDAR